MDHDPSLVNALDALRRRRDDLDQAIKALETVIGAVPSTKDQRLPLPVDMSALVPKRRSQGGKAGAAGALRVLQARPGEGLSPQALAEGMIANGWDASGAEDPARAARAAGNRLRRTDHRVTLENGKFVFRPSGNGQQPLTTDEGGGFQPR